MAPPGAGAVKVRLASIFCFFALALSEPLSGAHPLARWREHGLIVSVVAVLAGAALAPKIAIVFLLSAFYLAGVDRLSVQLALTFTPKKPRTPNVPTGSPMWPSWKRVGANWTADDTPIRLGTTLWKYL